MEGLSIGSELNTEFGRRIRVLDQLGEGGQGVVYRVQYGNQKKALKWYRPKNDKIIDPNAFVGNLRNNMMAGSPSSDYLWPQDIIQTKDGGFGYVMDLLPSQYHEAGDILLNPGLMPSFKRLVDACLNTLTALRVLHDKGYSYKDLNYNNVAIEPHTGKVLIYDNDNVSPNNIDTGIRGYPAFMAPEVVLDKSTPTVRSDLHSMAVLIFYLLVLQHPLVGRRGKRRDDETNRRLFGTDPLFVFDPYDASNRIDPGTNNNALVIWPCLPKHIQDLFVEAFSQEALHNPNRRPNETRWIQELVRFRSEITSCRCGNEVFLQGTGPQQCERCKTVIGAPLRVDRVGNGFREALVPVLDDARIYSCQVLGGCPPKEALEPIAWMLSSKRNPNSIGMRNMSKARWEVTVGERKITAEPGQIIRLTEGMTIQIPGMRAGMSLLVCKNAR